MYTHVHTYTTMYVHRDFFATHDIIMKHNNIMVNHVRYIILYVCNAYIIIMYIGKYFLFLGQLIHVHVQNNIIIEPPKTGIHTLYTFVDKGLV
jgi:uncharacterized membrane protein YqhA